MAYGPRLVVVLLLFGCAAVLIEGRQPAPSPANQSQEARVARRFRVGIGAVRIDAVVPDRNGRIVSGLTADEIEVRQDGKPQKVTFAQFVSVLSGPAPARDTPRASGAEAVAVPPRPVKREEVQRTVAVVVDDLGVGVESFYEGGGGVRGCGDGGGPPRDRVGLGGTGGAGGGLQPFTTDRRVLHAAIDALQWNGASRSGVEPFKPLNVYTTSSGGGPPGAPTATVTATADPNDFKVIDALRSSMAAAGTLGALNLVVRGSRDLPGRKAIIFVSEGFRLMVPELTGPGEGDKRPDARLRIALDRVIDQATRAGVVIYSLDCRGLQTAGLQASDNLKSGGLAPGAMEGAVRAYAGDRVEVNRDTQEGMAYLAEQTGGFAVFNTNDLARGLGRITDDVRGYYVIGYVPPDGTFVRQGQKPQLHKISIDVKRPGVRVKTRKEFLGVSDPPDIASPLTPAQELVHAATSPFAATDIGLRATTLPGYAPADGMFVRTLLQIDAHALTFVDGQGGKKTAAADVLGMVVDQEGAEGAHLSTAFSVALTTDAADAALRDGLVYTLRIPIRRPGGYQVRFAVRDQHSGALGSTGEFVDVGDIAGGAFALSGIVLRPEDGAGRQAAGRPDQIALTAAQPGRGSRPGARITAAD